MKKRNAQQLALILLLPFLSPCVFSETVEPPKIHVEQNGIVTNMTVEGNLASYINIGCISLSEVKNTFTPADLYKGVRECIKQENFDRAANLFMLAGLNARFDAERITDKTAGQARVVLIMNTFSNVPQDQKDKFGAAVKRLTENTEFLGKLCNEINKIGIPDYYPSYMILHGVKAFTGNPHERALITHFDALSVWKKLQFESLQCTN